MVFLNKKNLSFAGFFAILLSLHTGCTKEQIAPANQSLAFVKYYGHVGDQQGSDLQRTLDGGYIMIGSTNSYSSQVESDILVVKTDSLGNEIWSTALGKAAGQYVGSVPDLVGKYIRYKEEGIKIAELPDASGFIVTGNRTYVSYIGEFSSIPFNPEYKTKIVMYQLNAAGVQTSLDGVELRASTEFTEKVSDMKIDTSDGLLRYIVTGSTTNVATNKITGPLDKTDVFTMLMDETFTSLWSPGLLTYGFNGEDYGVSVLILPDYYVVTGTVQEQILPDPFFDKLFAVVMYKVGGNGGTNFGGDENFDMLGGHSVYDAANRRITIAGSVNDGDNLYIGHAVLYQLDENLAVQSAGTGNNFGFLYFRPTAPTTFPPATKNYYRPKSIALLPENTGFVISATHEKNPTENNISIMKVNQNLEMQTGWPYYFGYEDVSGTFATKESAGTVITVTQAITGTSQSVLKGYAFTGTFDNGTNGMIGLVKLNDDGTLNP